MAERFNIAQYYGDLVRLFKGTPIARQRIAAKISSPGEPKAPIGTAKAFLRDANSMYSNMMASYTQYSRMARYSAYCLGKQTLIWTIEYGPVEIWKLAELYPTEKDIFHVYSYDHEEQKVVVNEARYVRKTKVDRIFRVHFSNDGYIDASADHKFLLRDGTYRAVKELKSDDALMPFYRAKFQSSRDYVSVNTLKKDEKNRRYYRPEHVYLMEYLKGERLDGAWNNKPTQVVHHLNHIPDDNRLSNLMVMSEKEHQKYHSQYTAKHNKEMWNDDSFRQKFSKTHSSFMRENNPSARRDISFEKMIEFAKSKEKLLFSDLRKHFKCSDAPLLKRMRENGINKFSDFCKIVGVQYVSFVNSRPNNQVRKISFQDICSVYEDNYSLKDVADKLGCSSRLISLRVKENGYSTWNDFRTNYKNHKVVFIEDLNKTEELYDLSTDINHNVAAGSAENWILNEKTGAKIMNGFVFVHQCEMESEALVASAMDLLAEEACAKNEYDKLLKIQSENPKIKRILTELFEDVLNIDFEAIKWIRNCVKYGDHFCLVDHHPDYGVLGLHNLPVNEMEIEHGYNKENPLEFKYRWLNGNKDIEKVFITHFKMPGNDQFWPYRMLLH